MGGKESSLKVSTLSLPYLGSSLVFQQQPILQKLCNWSWECEHWSQAHFTHAKDRVTINDQGLKEDAAKYGKRYKFDLTE